LTSPFVGEIRIGASRAAPEQIGSEAEAGVGVSMAVGRPPQAERINEKTKTVAPKIFRFITTTFSEY
jgi:hypothetical protein